jgi:putative FmdB family regulatory protein
MPTYDYKCKQCEHQFENFQSITSDPLSECPECGGEVKRLIGPGAGFIFKGSGFYITDYRSKSYNESKQADARQGDTASGGGGDKPCGGGNCGKAECAA